MDLNAWRAACHILCVRLDNMGDVLMSTPAMQALRDAQPRRRLTLLTSHGGAALRRHLPMVDHVMAWNAPWVRHPQAWSARTLSHDIRACASRLAHGRFDAAVIFTVYTQSPLPAAFLCALAGIPLRLACCRENPYALLTDWVAESEPSGSAKPPRHEVARQLDLVASVGATIADNRLRFHVRGADQRAVARTIAAIAREPVAARVVIHPGASAASRRWPAERFAEVARALAQRADALVLVTGGADEIALADQVCGQAAHARVHALAGVLSLGEMGALLASADLLVSNNTGPVHLAAAVGTPVVDLYALTNPQHTPWQVPHRTLFADVPCRYCYKSSCPQQHHRCLADVPAQMAVDAALALLAGEPVPATPMPWGGPPVTPQADSAIDGGAGEARQAQFRHHGLQDLNEGAAYVHAGH